MDLSRFFTIGVDTAEALPASYDPTLVILSYAIAALAGFAFLRFTSRIIELQDSVIRFCWMGAGALVMGLGVWAMHFVAMLAYRLPIAVGYDALVTAISALPAVLGSAVALHVVARPTVTMLRLLLGGVSLGAGIGLMHYTGMAAMRFDAFVSYDPLLFTTSIVVAVALAFMALFSTLWTMRRGEGGPVLAREIVGAAFMGLAVSGMHYTAMTSAFCFAVADTARGVLALDPEVFAAATTSVAVLVLVLAIAGVIFDRRLSMEIARRQQAAERARMIDRRMRDAIETMPDGLAVFDRNDGLTIWNSRYLEDEWSPEILKPGATYTELVRHRVETQFAHESPERRQARIAERIDLFKNFKAPMMMPRPDGRWFFVRVRRTADGDTVLVRTEITAVKQAEEMLRQHEQHLALVMDNVADGLVTLDSQGVIGSFNRSAERIFGYGAAEMIGKKITMLLVEPDRTQLAVHLRRLATTPQSLLRAGEPREVAALHKNGSKLSVEVVLSRAEQGDNAIFIGALRDITERKAIHAQLQQAQKMEAIGQLTGGIAHDFNNLLGIIIGNLDLLKEMLNHQTKQQALVDAALDSALRGADLNQRLLAFARRQSLQPERIDPAEVLSGMRNLLNRAMGERVTVRLNHGEGIWPIKVDLAQLESAIINLAVNARDAMPDGGTLTVETSNVVIDQDYVAGHVGARAGEYVCVVVSDTGTGMTAETQARAFDPFFTTKPTGKGSGLGLSMVFGFVQQSDGHVNIYSEPGHGTAVRLYLPRADAGEMIATDRAANERMAAPLPTGSEIVLLVEDNDAMGDIAAKQLTDLGYRVIGAKNAEHALKIIDDGAQIDLLFTDVIMPGALDGIALTHEAKRRRPNLKVLLTSGFSHRASGVPGIDSEIVLPARLLTKPYRKHHLAESIRQALDE